MLQGQSSVARIGKESVGDPLIACILFVAQHFGQTFQRGALSSLARDERGFLPFHQAEAALDLCFINNERLHSRKVRGFARDLPAIIRRQGGDCAVLIETKDDQYLVWEAGADAPVWADEDAVEASYAGQAIAVSADPTAIRAEERPWTVAIRERNNRLEIIALSEELENALKNRLPNAIALERGLLVQASGSSTMNVVP